MNKKDINKIVRNEIEYWVNYLKENLKKEEDFDWEDDFKELEIEDEEEIKEYIHNALCEVSGDIFHDICKDR